MVNLLSFRHRVQACIHKTKYSQGWQRSWVHSNLRDKTLKRPDSKTERRKMPRNCQHMDNYRETFICDMRITGNNNKKAVILELISNSLPGLSPEPVFRSVFVHSGPHLLHPPAPQNSILLSHCGKRKQKK